MNANISNDLSKSEVDFLLHSIAFGYTYEMISQQLKKDVSLLKKTLLSVICQKIENQEGIEAYFCNEYGVSPKDIEEHKKSYTMS